MYQVESELICGRVSVELVIDGEEDRAFGSRAGDPEAGGDGELEEGRGWMCLGQESGHRRMLAVMVAVWDLWMDEWSLGMRLVCKLLVGEVLDQTLDNRVGGRALMSVDCS
jgi:hypothetical protein